MAHQYIKYEQDGEHQTFLPPLDDPEDLGKRESRTWTSYLRLLLEVAMAITIVVLSFWLALQSKRESKKPSPVPQFPRKTYAFHENKTYLHEDMFSSKEETLRTLHNWIPLSSQSRGYVQVPDYKSYDLGEPYSVRISHSVDGPAYMMSVFHQLHCLSYIVEHYQAGFDGGNLSQDIAHHSAHCFNYLRQSIICSADTSLEGKTEEGPGLGSNHQCVDYDMVLDWANEHATYKWHMVPDNAGL